MQLSTSVPFALVALVALGLACSSGGNSREGKASQQAETAARAPNGAEPKAPADEATPTAETPPPPKGDEEVGVPTELTDAGDMGASEGEEVREEAPTPASEAESPTAEPAPAETGGREPEAAPSESVAETPPETTPETPPETTPPAPTETAIQVKVPEGPVWVSPTRLGLSYVGTEKCKVCHKIQYQSWMETKHAKLTPPLDCEACHGPGSDYRVLKVMKDPEEARERGLVIPTAEFCATCHVGGWTDAMLKKAHAHKESPQ